MTSSDRSPSVEDRSSAKEYKKDVEVGGPTMVVADDVFGVIKEGGPNYRDVRPTPFFSCPCPSLKSKTDSISSFCTAGRMDRYFRPHDEDSDWFGVRFTTFVRASSVRR